MTVALAGPIARNLRRKAIDVEFISGARIPIVKFYDRHLKLHCDLCVGNGGASFKSHCLRVICDLDPRARAMAYVVKQWAKTQGINNSQGGTMNSFCLTMLAIFHLQTRDIPILPPFKELLTDLDGTVLASHEEIRANASNFFD